MGKTEDKELELFVQEFHDVITEDDLKTFYTTKSQMKQGDSSSIPTLVVAVFAVGLSAFSFNYFLGSSNESYSRSPCRYCIHSIDCVLFCRIVISQSREVEQCLFS
jgi:hypothetical protein